MHFDIIKDLGCPLVDITQTYRIHKIVNVLMFACYSLVAIYKPQAELPFIFKFMRQFINNSKHNGIMTPKKKAIYDFELRTQGFKIFWNIASFLLGYFDLMTPHARLVIYIFCTLCLHLLKEKSGKEDLAMSPWVDSPRCIVQSQPEGLNMIFCSTTYEILCLVNFKSSWVAG